MKTARLCFGGSFNPIHNAHLLCSRAAAIKENFGTVVLIPSAQPPHKRNATDLASPADRLAMTQLAGEFAGDETIRFEVSDIELRRQTPSYTIDTARELRELGWPRITWLIGADQLNALSTWHKADELLDEVDFLILARPGVPLNWNGLPDRFRTKLQSRVVEAPLMEITATEIRRRVRAGESIDDLVPPPVARYIESHAQYRD